MMWVFGIVVVLILGAVAVVAAGHGDGLAPTYDDRRDVLVPAERPLEARDLRRVRFTVGPFGYRASEVDALLARLADELDARGGAPAETRSADHDTAHDPGEDLERDANLDADEAAGPAAD